jgi:hypothetical protein
VRSTQHCHLRLELWFSFVGCSFVVTMVTGSLQLPVCSPLEESLGHANECLKLMAQNGLGASGFVGVHDCIDQTMTS